MYSDVDIKIKKKNKILFSKNSECLKELVELMNSSSHKELVLWAFDCCETTLDIFEEKYQQEKRPRICRDTTIEWSKGKIKMPIAKKAILDCHRVSKEIDDSEYGAMCHAIGHACATVHVQTHAIGLVIYELTSLVIRYGEHSYHKPVTEKIEYYINKLLFWKDDHNSNFREWASFFDK